MSLTQYVIRLSPTGEPPDMASFLAALAALRGLLVHAMKQRGLWTAPPAYLDITAASWSDPDALDELVSECYTWNFLRRLEGLRQQALLGREIEGLVARNIRHLLTDRQRRADPIGYRVYEILHAALSRAVKSGHLRVLDDDKKKKNKKTNQATIHNDTRLSFQRKRFGRRTASSPTHFDGETATDFETTVAAWNDDLLPELLTARSKAVPKVVERLAEHVLALAGSGVEAFTFKALVDPMKRDARRRWDSVWETSLGDIGTEVPDDEGAPAGLVLVDLPRSSLAFRHFLDCVGQAIGAQQQKAREHLWSLWVVVRSQADSTDKRLSQSKASAALGISRDRVAQLLAVLARFIEACRQSTPDQNLDADALIPAAEKAATTETSRSDRPGAWRNVS